MDDDTSYVLNYKWAFGLNHKITSGIQYLTSSNRNQVLYASAHTGVIYDYESNKQFLLRGHCNTITCLCKSHDDHWVATADSGPDSLIIVWDTQPSLTLKQEQEYQQQMLRNAKNTQILASNQENNEIDLPETISRESSTETIDFESLRNKDDTGNRLNLIIEREGSNSEEEEEEEEDDIENEIKNIITNDIDKPSSSSTNENENEEKNESINDLNSNNNNNNNNEEIKNDNQNEIQPISPNEETTSPTTPINQDEKDETTTTVTTDTAKVDNSNNNNNNDNEKKDENNTTNNDDENKNKNNNNTIIEKIEQNNNNDVEHIDDIFGSNNKNNNKVNEFHNDYDTEVFPVKTIVNPHHNCGVVTMKMSNDSKYLITLGADSPQTICIWNWTMEDLEPICEFQLSCERQEYIDFNPSNPFEFVTNGEKSIYFYTWDLENGIQQHKPLMTSKEFSKNKLKYTYTIFIPNTQKALSATENGSIILWDNCNLMNLSKKLDDGNKSAIKIMKLHNGPINVIDIINDKYFITGGEDGFIRIYDFQYRLYIWLEKINGGPVLSLSFNKNRPGPSIVNSINIPDFMVLTKHAKILHVFNGDNDEVNNKKRMMVNMKDNNSINSNNNNLDSITKILEENNQKPQVGKSSATENKKNLNDLSKNSPNYDIDKFITISRFPQFKIILEAQYEKVSSIQSHPLKPELAIAGYSGLLQIYNYYTKELIIQRLFEIEEEKKDDENDDEKEKDKNKDKIHSLIKKKVFIKKVNKIESIAYSNKGTYIAVGFTNGSIKIIDSSKLEDILTTPDKTLQICSVQKPITQFTWSMDDSILAAADDDNGVSIIVREEINFSKKNINPDFKLVEIHGKCLSIFKDDIESNNNTRNYYMGDDVNLYEWNFIGRYQSHWKKIIKIFFMQSTPPRLLSLGQDRMIIEYDLENSSFINGIKIKVKKQLEQTATPSALCLNYSRNEYNNNEEFFITANEDYKLKLFNSNTFLCRKTVMSPNYGSPINKMCILPIQNTHQKYLAYSTQNSIIGILKLPLSGNPYDNLGVMAHSGEIVGLCCSKDGHYVFSCDSYNTSVNMWSVHVDVLEAQNAIGGKGNEPFIKLLDPNGRDSAIYKEMEDYFYYAQLRTQGEDCIRNRTIEKKIGISEVASILQAIGYYPSEQDIEDIKNEIKYSKVLETGDYIEYIEFEDIIRIYLNHKPAEDLTKKQIENALLHSKEFEMPNLESENDESNDIYYMGETDKREYLENFQFKKSDDNEVNIINKILKSKSSSSSSIPSSKNNSTQVLNDKSSEDNLSKANDDNNKDNDKDNDNEKDPQKSTNSIMDETSDNNSSKKSKDNDNSSKSNLNKKKSKEKEIDLDDEDLTEARYKVMKMNETERKEKMEKARQKKEMIKSIEYGKFSKSALLSMLQQYGESLSADLFEDYIDKLLHDNPSDYKQLAEFFTLDEFVNNVLNFEEEILPETLIEKLNKNNNQTIEDNNSNNNNNNTEPDTEPYYVYTE